MTDKRTEQVKRNRTRNYYRKRDAYELVKLLAAADGVPLPNNQNGGVELDGWLSKRLQEMKMIVTAKRGMKEITRKIWNDSNGWAGYELTEIQDRQDGMMYPAVNGEQHWHFDSENEAKEWLHALS